MPNLNLLNLSQVAIVKGLANALDLEKGDTQYVEIGDIAALDLASGNWTLEMWLNFESTVGTTSLINKGAGATGWRFYHNGTNNYFYILYYRPGQEFAYTLNNAHDENDGWMHVAATFDESGDSLKLYVDGVDETTSGSGIHTGNPILNNDAVKIGYGVTGQVALDGIIQNVRISNSVRYTENFTPSTSVFANDANTLGLWWLDDDLTDQASGGNDGTFQKASGSETYVEGTLIEN